MRSVNCFSDREASRNGATNLDLESDLEDGDGEIASRDVAEVES